MGTEFDLTVDGFMRDLAYTAHLPMLFKEFEGAFPGLERINVLLHERSFSELSHQTQRPPFFSFKDRVGTMRYDTQRYYHQQGRVQRNPEPADVLRELRERLNKAKEQYATDPSRP